MVSHAFKIYFVSILYSFTFLKLYEFLQIVNYWDILNCGITSRDDPEAKAKTNVDSIRITLTGFCPLNRARICNTPWWNNEYQFAAQVYRRARRLGPETCEKKST